MEARSFPSNRLRVQVDSLPPRVPMNVPAAWPQILDFLGENGFRSFFVPSLVEK
jgi:hypothetical protein